MGMTITTNTMLMVMMMMMTMTTTTTTMMMMAIIIIIIIITKGYDAILGMDEWMTSCELKECCCQRMYRVIFDILNAHCIAIMILDEGH